MSHLIDTHALLWARSNPELLTTDARSLLDDRTSSLYVSIASLWECAIKRSIGKLRLPERFYQAVATDYGILGIDMVHIEAYEKLPMHHRDPFDRLLVAQAQVGDLTIVTRDQNIPKYDVAVMRA